MPDGQDDEWRPSCWDCGREFQSVAALVRHPVHIEHDDGPGYERVPVYLCPACRKARLPTHQCQHCGQEYIDLTDAAECCQHRAGRPVPDGGTEEIDGARCGRIRWLLDHGADPDVVADELGHDPVMVRKHARGDCDHEVPEDAVVLQEGSP